MTASAGDVCLDYLPVLRERLTLPLIRDEQSEGVKEVVGLLEEYDLLKDDYDSILDLTQWPNQKDPRNVINSKVRYLVTVLE